MRRSATLFAFLLVGVTLLSAAASSRADRPTSQTLYRDGQTGRFLLGGKWLFRLDPADSGLKERWQRQAGMATWKAITVPNAWNFADSSNQSMAGGVGWYRKDFQLPSAAAALSWVVRFESVNYRAKVWLNGVPIGQHKGAYIPFELDLSHVKRKGTNTLVVRVDSRRKNSDVPPLNVNDEGVPSTGWWNDSGILREVYLRKVDAVDISQVRVRPELKCSSCAAKVGFRAILRNPNRHARTVAVTARFGTKTVSLGRHNVPAHSSATFTNSLTLPKPKLWSPSRPYLYPVTVQARLADGGRVIGTYKLRTGVRTIRVDGSGRIVVNGEYVNLRGFGVHEDEKGVGAAASNAFRKRLVDEAQAAGGKILRTHYPLHPYLHELADERGLFIWSEIPVFQLREEFFKQESVRNYAYSLLKDNIQANENHPSVLVWSVSNELSSRPGYFLSNYYRTAAQLAHLMDPTRPVAAAISGYSWIECQKPAYQPLDVIGINDYYGWYPGPAGLVADRSFLPDYLESMRKCYPSKGLMITEFGAEANRTGPTEEKGTYDFQRDFVNFHLGVFSTKPWLNGAIYWALNEFRVRPNWTGGNPRPNSPIHQKGLISYDWKRKPAWNDVRALYQATKQVNVARASDAPAPVISSP